MLTNDGQGYEMLIEKKIEMFMKVLNDFVKYLVDLEMLVVEI